MTCNPTLTVRIHRISSVGRNMSLKPDIRLCASLKHPFCDTSVVVVVC